jgi:hypothetical protein
MEHYSELYLGDELVKLRDGFEVLERVVDSSGLKDLELYLYGITSDPFILDIAKEAIINSGEEFLGEDGEPVVNEGDIELNEIAIAIAIPNSDHIDILYGRGFPLQDLSFAYQAGDGEGIRTLGFYNAFTQSGAVKIDKLGDKALAETDMYLDAFLKDKGKGLAMQVNRKVQRTEEATVDAPHAAEPPKPEVPNPAESTPRAASTTRNLSAIVEKFLG